MKMKLSGESTIAIQSSFVHSSPRAESRFVLSGHELLPSAFPLGYEFYLVHLSKEPDVRPPVHRLQNPIDGSDIDFHEPVHVIRLVSSVTGM